MKKKNQHTYECGVFPYNFGAFDCSAILVYVFRCEVLRRALFVKISNAGKVGQNVREYLQIFSFDLSSKGRENVVVVFCFHGAVSISLQNISTQTQAPYIKLLVLHVLTHLLPIVLCFF
jgi:hypothetical protein